MTLVGSEMDSIGYIYIDEVLYWFTVRYLKANDKHGQITIKWKMQRSCLWHFAFYGKSDI
jgi:hypothetical protein